MTLSKKNKKRIAFGLMVLIGTISVASASVPSRITDDTALYQNLSEIRVRKERELSFENDVSKLSKMESHFREPLPRVEQSPAVKRISHRKYSPSQKRSVKQYR